jgi:anti-anti-sigma factor
MPAARTKSRVSEPGSPPTSHDQLSLSTNWLSAAVVRITAAGAIDASNAAELADYVFRHAANSRRLILDLKSVDFFGTAGFSTLMNIQARCAYAAVKWTLVSSRAVSRVLEICDPRGTLPIAKSA